MRSWNDDGPVIWTPANIPGACYLTELDGFEREHVLTRGESLCDQWPAGASYRMDPHSPRDMLVPDAVAAVRPVIVASARLADLLRDAMPDEVELLPVAIVNHKRRKEPGPFFIVNPVGLVDCLMIDRCGVKWSTITSERIDSFKRLVIDPARIDGGRSMFRMRYLRGPVLLRRSLAKKIDESGFTGVAWTELVDYKED